MKRRSTQLPIFRGPLVLGEGVWYNSAERGNDMAEVLEQINRMSREEKIRLAYLLLDAIENGTVVKPSAPMRVLKPDPFLSQVEIKGSLFDDDSDDWEAMNG